MKCATGSRSGPDGGEARTLGAHTSGTGDALAQELYRGQRCENAFGDGKAAVSRFKLRDRAIDLTGLRKTISLAERGGSVRQQDVRRPWLPDFGHGDFSTACLTFLAGDTLREVPPPSPRPEIKTNPLLGMVGL